MNLVANSEIRQNIPGPDGYPKSCTPRPGWVLHGVQPEAGRTGARVYSLSCAPDKARQGLLQPPRLAGTSRALGIGLETRDPPRYSEKLIAKAMPMGFNGFWVSFPSVKSGLVGQRHREVTTNSEPSEQIISSVCINCVCCALITGHEVLSHTFLTPIPV